MNRIRTGCVVLAMVLLSATATGAQETPAPIKPDSAAPNDSPSDAPSDADIANMALVCVATYDLVLAVKPTGPLADDAADARDLARSIYIEASQSDEATADDDIARVDKALAAAISSGQGNLDEYHSTCDSLLMDDDQDSADTGAIS
ncbi:hypothetical protein [Asticcacaulis taihuensis]|nr:hypothetical protein [Asticcacaulis taihuensis]